MNILHVCMGAVHDRQLVDDIPVEKLLIHDVPVDIICTPTQIIRTNTRIPKPQGQLGILASDHLYSLIVANLISNAIVEF